MASFRKTPPAIPLLRKFASLAESPTPPKGALFGAKPQVDDPYYGHEQVSRLCARYITQLFACPEHPPSPSPPLANFIAYALYRTKLHSAVLFSALIFLERLKARFPNAKGSSGHRLFLSAYLLAHKVMCEDEYSTKSWYIVAQGMFPVREINQMEKEMCSYLDWDLNIECDELKVVERQFWSHTAPVSTSSHSSTSLSVEHGSGISSPYTVVLEFPSGQRGRYKVEERPLRQSLNNWTPIPDQWIQISRDTLPLKITRNTRCGVEEVYQLMMCNSGDVSKGHLDSPRNMAVNILKPIEKIHQTGMSVSDETISVRNIWFTDDSKITLKIIDTGSILVRDPTGSLRKGNVKQFGIIFVKSLLLQEDAKRLNENGTLPPLSPRLDADIVHLMNEDRIPELLRRDRSLRRIIKKCFIENLRFRPSASKVLRELKLLQAVSKAVSSASRFIRNMSPWFAFPAEAPVS